jgi:hypothetical protein
MRHGSCFFHGFWNYQYDRPPLTQEAIFTTAETTFPDTKTALATIFLAPH